MFTLKISSFQSTQSYVHLCSVKLQLKESEIFAFFQASLGYMRPDLKTNSSL